ncbi:MAG: heme lyase CcmF/NrfE family subunit [Gammaproteobacteria bacterium]|nr:heme lyase CcmF/NrfE family subunit [Gammaproteobacteria bacterium]
MIAELGHFALILALCMAVVQGVLPLAGSFTRNANWIASGRPAAYGQCVFVAVSFAALTYAFVIDDFSVEYVASNSNTLLPIVYKVSAVWSAHEGSLLLWVLMLGGWGAAVAYFSRNLPDIFAARVLAIMGLVGIGFLLFILLTSNPFARLTLMPAEGRDMNPLLQDPGLAIHPPMLYMGYVGLSVAFSFAIAALIGGRLDSTWARWSRPWTTIAWVFLTIGITLGSWWAYNELGWGGWWFWDPVENASFMPWLIATALIHSLAITEKRGAFKSWTVLLAILGFSLSLLGAFLVRSGVLTSVHAFATDPARGLFILLFLCVVIGGSLALYAWRGPGVSRGGQFHWMSRETLLLGNNLVLVSVTGFVLLGTLAPLIYDALGWGKISVGFPWFNTMFIGFMPFLGILLGAGPVTRWKSDDPVGLLKRLRWAALASLALALLAWLPLYTQASWQVALGIGLSAWIGLATLAGFVRRVRDPRGLVSALRKQSRSYYGMVLAHLGVAAFVLGVTLVSLFGIEKDVGLKPGESVTLAGYEFKFAGVESVRGPNYRAERGSVSVTRDGALVATLHPEKRRYFVQTQPMTEAAIDVGATRDLYVSLGEPLGEGAWSVRVYYKPFVRWIWGGGFLAALGGLLAVSDKRYRLSLRRKIRVKVAGAEVPA